MPQRRMSLSDAAEYLHLTVQELERLVTEGGVPFDRHGARPVFTRKEIDAWASRRILGSSAKSLDNYHRKTAERARRQSAGGEMVAQMLRPEAVAATLDARTRSSVLKEMVALAERTGLVNYPKELLEMLRQREEMCSTALPGGLALLHPRHHDPYMFGDSFIALGRTPSAVPFGAPDGAPTDLFFLICCRDDRLHLHILARLCLLCTQTELAAALRSAKDTAAMQTAVAAAENEAAR